MKSVFAFVLLASSVAMAQPYYVCSVTVRNHRNQLSNRNGAPAPTKAQAKANALHRCKDIGVMTCKPNTCWFHQY